MTSFGISRRQSSIKVRRLLGMFFMNSSKSASRIPRAGVNSAAFSASLQHTRARRGRAIKWRPLSSRLLREHFHESHPAGRVATEIDAVRIGRIDVDSAWIGFGFRQGEFDPFFGAGIEACDLVDLV